MQVKHKKTGQIASSRQWNPAALSEIIVQFPDRSASSEFAKDWVCACHGLPPRENSHGHGIVMCKLQADKELKEALEKDKRRIHLC